MDIRNLSDGGNILSFDEFTGIIQSLLTAAGRADDAIGPDMGEIENLTSHTLSALVHNLSRAGSGRMVFRVIPSEQLHRVCKVGQDRYGGADDLDMAIEGAEAILAAMPTSDPSRADLLEDLHQYAGYRYTRFGRVADLAKCIERGEEALAATPPDHPARPRRWGSLCEKLYTRFKRLGDLRDIERAINYLRQALEVTPADAVYRAILMNLLGNCLRNRFQELGNLEDLEDAINQAEGILAMAPAGIDRGTILGSLGSYFQSRYLHVGNIEDLDKCQEISEEVLATTPTDHPNRAGFLLSLGCCLYSRYLKCRSLETLDGAIKQTEEALATAPTNHPDKVCMLRYLGSYYQDRYTLSRDLEDIEKAIRNAGMALAATPTDHPSRAPILRESSSYFYDRSKRSGSLEDLEKAIKQDEEAMAATPADDPDHIGSLDEYHYARYGRLGCIEDLENAIKYCKVKLVATGAHPSNRATIFGNLSSCFYQRYVRSKDLGDSEEAIKYVREALAASNTGDPYQVELLQTLATFLYRQFLESANIEDLDQAIKLIQEAFAAAPTGNCGTTLYNWGAYLLSRYDARGNLEDLEGAIKHINEGLAASYTHHRTYRAEFLRLLGLCHHSRYELNGDLGDLEEAIKSLEQGLAAPPTIYFDREDTLGCLGRYYSERFGQLGNLDDLENAIIRTEEALAVAPADSTGGVSPLKGLESPGGLENSTGQPENELLVVPKSGGQDNLVVNLFGLGTLRGNKYSLSGGEGNLGQAIKLTAEALAMIPANNPNRSITLACLANWLCARYSRFGAISDLERALNYSEEALAATPISDPKRSEWLRGHSNCLSLRYERLGLIEDLEKAIELSRESVLMIPKDPNARAHALVTLGIHLKSKYQVLGAIGDLEESILYCRKGLAVVPMDRRTRAYILKVLGSSLALRCSLSGDIEDIEDIEEAIKLLEEAVDLIDTNDPSRGYKLEAFSSLLCCRFGATNDTKDLERALNTALEAWNCTISPPRDRIMSACRAAFVLELSERWEEASSFLEDAIKLLPSLSPRFLGRSDQEQQLDMFSRLTSNAMLVALKAGKPVPHCLELLELGRGIIIGLVMDCRSDLSDLQERNPDFFKRFHLLRSEVDSMGFGGSNYGPMHELRMNDESYESMRDQRVKVVAELEDTIAGIRQLPDFESFLLPPTSEGFMAMAGEGPIITVIAGSPGQAIIVSSTAIKALLLPGLEYKEVESKMSWLYTDLLRGKRSSYSSRNKKMHEFLLWLWNVAVEPVLEELKFYSTTVSDNDSSTDNSVLPRLWWIGVGPLATAPFHAAGDHSPGSTRNTMSRAISSYIPTFKALSYARERRLELLGLEEAKLLLVTMPTTPGHSPLDSVTREAAQITSVVKTTSTMLLERPNAADVIEELGSYQAIHFACHGVSDARNPSNSHLLLFKDDGSESGIVDRLTAGAISGVNLKAAQIAYLSACSTANNHSALPDESIHIASGFQLAGFSHVLATSWRSEDSACQAVAVEFYRTLFDGEGGQGHEKVSRAFHGAVRKLRERFLKQPLIWTPFIHTGA